MRSKYIEDYAILGLKISGLNTGPVLLLSDLNSRT